MQNNYQQSINTALKELFETKNISSAISVGNTLLEYIGLPIKSVEDVELSKLKLPNAERYDRWFDAHPHFRGDRACFELTSKDSPIEAKFYALKKRSKLFIAGSVNFTPNFEDRDYTRNDPSMRIGIDFFLTPEKDSVIVVLSNKGNLRLVELSKKLTNTQVDIFALWHDIAKVEDKNTLHTTIWESFKLSSLNKDFYKGISNSFTSLTQHLRDSGVEEQLANQFSNRLLGRLLFIWFLRKKNIINEAKEYFVLDGMDDTGYYKEKLEYLFFNVLNTDIPDRENVQKGKGTLFGVEKEAPSLFVVDSLTPYLNGGLFDPKADGEYWEEHSPTFPTGFFKNLYEHFDSFNFTTDESTPEYEQIAIDPEMLGRIFESFLATLTTETGAQAKKANGAFYTPREIVGYMSRESLRQYLYTALEAGVTLKSSIDDLLDIPDSDWALSGSNSKRDAVAKEDRERIMDALRNIRVLDPAVGSGAFPMGILHKILSLFERLDPNFDAYETKLSILRNNIYGVDIDPTAIEISRLRAWLSIIVDVKDIKKIKPLPNLEFKFVCANSLIGLEKGEVSFTSDENLKPELMRIRDEYYATSSKIKKEKLQKEYIKLTHKESLFDTEETRQLKSYQPFENGKIARFYDTDLMHGVKEFDVVIGNPPYIKEHTNRDAFNGVRESEYYQGKMDLWYLFACRFIDVLKSDVGILSFIATNNWVTNAGASRFRNKIAKDTRVISLIDFCDYKIFESASIQTMITIVQKSTKPAEYTFDYRKIIDKHITLDNISQILNKVQNDKFEYLDPVFNRSNFENKTFVFNNNRDTDILSKIFKKGNFYIDGKNELMSGVDVLQDFVNKQSLKKIDPTFKVGDGVFVISNQEKEALGLSEKESYLLKPYYTTKELQGIWGNKKNTHWIIYTNSSFKNPDRMNDYPMLKKHLDKFKDIITSENGPYGLNRPREEIFFQGEKIMSTRKCATPVFSYTDFDCYVSRAFFSIKTNRVNQKYLAAILNSKVIAFWLENKGKMQGNNYQIDKEPILEIPIFVGSETEQKCLISIVDQILTSKKGDPKADTKDLESQIDTLVYQLYDLTPEEIKIIETQK